MESLNQGNKPVYNIAKIAMTTKESSLRQPIEEVFGYLDYLKNYNN